MARKEAGINHTMITQDFISTHWDWKDDEVIALDNEDIEAISKIIINRFNDKNIKINECYAIKHNKDIREIWDDKLNKLVEDYKTNHVHIVLRFDSKLLLSDIADIVGLKSQFIEKPKPGRYSYDNMLAYLIHAKETDKYEYNPKEVATIIGCDYYNIYCERKVAWDKGKAKKKTQKSKLDIDWLEDKISHGEIKKSQVLLTDEYFDIYYKNKVRCENAFSAYAERKIYKTLQAMENGDLRKISVFYVTGKSGSGKSYFTDRLVEKIKEEAKKNGCDWSSFSAAATNPFDEYNGEEILVLDDLRGASLSASDWLKLLDPDRISIGSARYSNKMIASRVIIINSEKDVLDFFYYVKGVGSINTSEAMDQFFRRILARIVVYNYNGDSERKVSIGRVNKTDVPYLLESPKGDTKLTMHYDYKNNEIDLPYESGLNYIVDLVSYMNKWKNEEPITDENIINISQER